MSRLRIVIQRIDDDTPNERITELDRIDVSPLDARFLEQETALDHLEAQTLAHGHAVMRRLLVRQWERVDDPLADNYRELFSPVPGEGGRPAADQGGLSAGDRASAAPAVRARGRGRARHPGE